MLADLQVVARERMSPGLLKATALLQQFLIHLPAVLLTETNPTRLSSLSWD